MTTRDRDGRFAASILLTPATHAIKGIAVLGRFGPIA
jgi:hypothetical protein